MHFEYVIVELHANGLLGFLFTFYSANTFINSII